MSLHGVSFLAASSAGGSSGHLYREYLEERNPSELTRRAELCEVENPERAARLYREAMEAGSVQAKVHLGFLLLLGLGVPKDEVRAGQLFQEASASGDADGTAYLGKMYLTGKGGFPYDTCEAGRLFQMAAEGGSAEGMAYLGQAYRYGWGVPRNKGEETRWTLQASSLRNANGLYFHGMLSDEGCDALPKDNRRAGELFLESARLGNSKAMYALSLRFSGDNPALSLDWLHRSAALHNELAMTELAENFYCDSKRKGVPRDEGKAFRLYREEADLGFMRGMLGIAHLREIGIGCSRDENEANRWKKLACQIETHCLGRKWSIDPGL